MDVVAPVAQLLVERRFAAESRRVIENSGQSPAISRRELVAVTRRYLRRARRWQATRSLPGHPAACEERRFSQNGEDGIIAAILERIGLTSGVFAEIGAADGEENCTRALAETGRWAGVWVEGDPGRAARAEAVGRSIGVTTVHAFVERDNIVDLLADTGAIDDTGLDVLVIDVDGNDWYLWRELARHHRPALVVTEVNGAFGPWVDWVMPYDPVHRWQEDRRHGATLRAFDRLARALGYVLVACDGAGVNAFWVRADLVRRFPAAGQLRNQYAPPRHKQPGGHPWCATPAFDIPALAADELGAISLDRPELVVAPRSGFANGIVVDVVNGSEHSLASSGLNPVNVAARWGEHPSAHAWTEPDRGPLRGVIAPGARAAAVVMLPPQTAEFATVDLVQDGVRWAHDVSGWEPLHVGAP